MFGYAILSSLAGNSEGWHSPMFLSSQEQKEYKNVVLYFTMMITSGFWGMLKTVITVAHRLFREAAVEMVKDNFLFRIQT